MKVSSTFATTVMLAIRSSCGVNIRLPNGPIGADHPENILIHQTEPISGPPDGGPQVTLPRRPEYGGAKPWHYTNLMEQPEEIQASQSILPGELKVQGIHPGQLQQTQQAPLGLSFSKLSFPLPPWLSQLINTAAGISSFLSGLGIQEAPSVLQCTSSPALKELMTCVQSTVSEGKEIFQTAQEIVVLNTRVMSGGRPADAALARLKTIASRPLAKKLMKVLGTTMMCTLLMQKELTPDRQRWQAGSIVTAVTDLPVASEINDTKSGSFGHVNVVLPRPSRIHRGDRMIKELSKGIDPVDTLAGGLGVEGRTDLRFPLSTS